MAILGRTRPRPRSHGESELGELPDLEDLGAAVRAGALNRRATVLHRDLLRFLDLDLLAFLDAVALRHRGPPFEPIPRVTLEHSADTRGASRVHLVAIATNYGFLPLLGVVVVVAAPGVAGVTPGVAFLLSAPEATWLCSVEMFAAACACCFCRLAIDCWS